MNPFEIIYRVIKFVTGFMPLKNIIILESIPDLADNTYALYQEMLRRGINKKYKLVWLLNAERKDTGEKLPENVVLQNRMQGSWMDKIKYLLYLSRAKYIIDCNNYIFKMHDRQIRIHLKHGLPMKDASKYNFQIGNTDIVSVPSEHWVGVCAKEHGINEKYIKPLGFPRNDILKPKPHEHKTVIWMPTWRNHRQQLYKKIDFKSFMPFGLPFITDEARFAEINELFKKNNAYLLIRLHPVQDVSGINLSEMSNIKLCNDAFLEDNNISLYSLLNYTDALVSDYSSVYYDYLNLSKPIALAVSDFDEYCRNNGILVKEKEEFKKTYPAVFLEGYEELIRFFEAVFGDDPQAYKCAEAQKKYMGINDGKAAERIINYMEDNLGL